MKYFQVAFVAVSLLCLKTRLSVLSSSRLAMSEVVTSQLYQLPGTNMSGLGGESIVSKGFRSKSG